MLKARCSPAWLLLKRDMVDENRYSRLMLIELIELRTGEYVEE